MKYLAWLTCACLGLVAFAACGDYEPPKHHPAPLGGGGGTGGAGGTTGTAAGGTEVPSGDAGAGGEAGAPEIPNGPKTVLVVLEGLRPEFVSPTLTPSLWSLAQHGVRFSNYLGVLPSNRVAAAATLATGAQPARHGVLGARMYLPGAVAQDSTGAPVDSQQPIRLEDQGTLEALQQNIPGGLLKSKTIIDVAQAAGFASAVIGRSGPASLFDLERAGWVLNDDYVWPRAFANVLVHLGVGLPNHASSLFPDLNGPPGYTPVADADTFGGLAQIAKPAMLPWTPVPGNYYLNPLLPSSHRYASTRALELAAATQVLADPRQDLLVLWVRDPGETALRNGPTSRATKDVLNQVDAQVGQLAASLPSGSNLIVTSDGGASALAGDPRFFPRWTLGRNGPVGAFWVESNTPGGVPVDGAVRLVDLLSRAGFQAYDGESCLSGHAYTAYPTLQTIATAPSWPSICTSTTFNSKGGELTGPALLPATLDPTAVVVASNGSGELVYLPSHRASEMQKLVAFLQSRPEVGALFLAGRYGNLPGTLDLGLLGFAKNAPVDLFVTYAWNSDDAVASAPLVDLTQPLEVVGPNQVLGHLLGDVSNCCVPTNPNPDCKFCRDGVVCDTGQLPQAPKCRFCPADRPLTDPDCTLSSGFDPASAQSLSAYQTEGDLCESSRVCGSGLSCLYGLCKKTGTRVMPAAVTPSDNFPRGSSYGAMAGVELSAPSVGPTPSLLRDYHGVRGGASPAELHGVLIASGPAFKQGVVSDLPCGLADVAPTLLHVLKSGLETELGAIDGRLLTEALVEPHTTAAKLAACPADRAVSGQKYCAVASSAAQGPSYSPTSPDSSAQTLINPTTSYSATLRGYLVQQGEAQYFYWTQAGATRSSLGCQHDSDCPAGITCGTQGVCLFSPNCSDGVKNGAETDVDCGSQAHCLPCARGLACSANGDCETNACSKSHVCVEPACTDGIQDGAESGTDCGFLSHCGPCPAGESCVLPADCASGTCTDETCE